MFALQLEQFVLDLAIPRRRHRLHALHLHAHGFRLDLGMELVDLLQVVQVRQPTVSHGHHALERPVLEQLAHGGQQGGCLGHVTRVHLVGDGQAAGRLQARWHDGREETVEAEGPGGSGANIMDFPHDAHRAVIADFLDAIEQGRDPAVTGEEALATQALIEEVLAKAG